MSTTASATKTTWKTSNGRLIKVSEMEDTHLVNTIKLLRRNAQKLILQELAQMANYINNAPDGAAMAAMSEADRIIEMTDDEYLSHRLPAFDALLLEAVNRGLI